MRYEIQVRVTPEIAYQQGKLRQYVATQLDVPAHSITSLRTLKRSIDARQRQVYVGLTVEVWVGEPAPEQTFEPVAYQDVSHAPQVVVVGAGPGGLFAALRLIELGRRPVVLERGKNVRDRKRDLA